MFVTFGLGELKCATDITAANDGRVMVMGALMIPVFTYSRWRENSFTNLTSTSKEITIIYIACHPAGEHVVRRWCMNERQVQPEGGDIHHKW